MRCEATAYVGAQAKPLQASARTAQGMRRSDRVVRGRTGTPACGLAKRRGAALGASGSEVGALRLAGAQLGKGVLK